MPPGSDYAGNTGAISGGPHLEVVTSVILARHTKSRDPVGSTQSPTVTFIGYRIQSS